MRVLSALLNSPWCITEDALRLLLTIAKREQGDLAAVEAQLGRKLEYTRAVTERGGVATIPIDGPIFRKANLFTSVSGASSVEILARDFTAALQNPQVRAIVLAIDSPGGEVTGIHEFAEMIHAARGVKPVWAYVEGLGASAAYWLASACEAIVCDPTAMLGSIGVIAAMDTADDPNQVTFVSAKSPNKHPDLTTEAGRAQMQALIDATAEVFIADVARNRGVSASAVVERFGAGGLKVGADAVRAGLADRLGSYEGVLAELQGRGRPAVAPALAPAAASGLSVTAGGLAPRRAAGGGALATDTPSLILGDAPELVTSLRASVAADPLRLALTLDRLAALTAPAEAPPPVSPAPAPARVPITQEESTLMPDITQREPEPQATAAVDVELSASEQAKIDRLVALREAEWKQREQLILQEAEARFERRMADERARRDIESYAQHITTPTLARPHALPGQTATYAAFLSSLSSEQRKAAQGLFDGILAAGLVSYAEIGSSGEGPGAGDTASEWAALVSAKVQAGMTRTAAIAAAARENPDLYAAQSAPKKGGK